MRLIKNLLLNRGKKKLIALTDKDIFYIFDKIIKEEFGNIGASNLKADFFKNKTIFVKSESSAWGSELFSNRTSIIKKLNKELGEGVVREIKIK